MSAGSEAPMRTMRVLEPGAHTSVQGLGVAGRAHRGYSRGGAADERASQLANLAVGNDVDARALELTLVGPTLQVERDVVLAWCGAPGEVRVIDEAGERALTALHPHEVRAGAHVICAPRTSGVRAVLAFAGGVRADAGTVLARDDLVTLSGAAVRACGARATEPFDLDSPIRVTDSVHTPALADAFARFTSEPFVVTPDASRRGVRLAAPAPLPVRVGDVPSFGVAVGTVQLPPSGQPIVLGVDQTTTGGYPALASIIRADAWRIAQLRPGATVRFTRVTHDDARTAWLAWLNHLGRAELRA